MGIQRHSNNKAVVGAVRDLLRTGKSWDDIVQAWLVVAAKIGDQESWRNHVILQVCLGLSWSAAQRRMNKFGSLDAVLESAPPLSEVEEQALKTLSMWKMPKGLGVSNKEACLKALLIGAAYEAASPAGAYLDDEQDCLMLSIDSLVARLGIERSVVCYQLQTKEAYKLWLAITDGNLALEKIAMPGEGTAITSIKRKKGAKDLFDLTTIFAGHEGEVVNTLRGAFLTVAQSEILTASRPKRGEEHVPQPDIRRGMLKAVFEQEAFGGVKDLEAQLRLSPSAAKKSMHERAVVAGMQFESVVMDAFRVLALSEWPEPAQPNKLKAVRSTVTEMRKHDLTACEVRQDL